MSRNHSDIEYINVISARNKTVPALENECIVNTPDVVKVNKLIELYNGQGEGETKWKG